jgi:hypothetical protein
MIVYVGSSMMNVYYNEKKDVNKVVIALNSILQFFSIKVVNCPPVSPKPRERHSVLLYRTTCSYFSGNIQFRGKSAERK